MRRSVVVLHRWLGVALCVIVLLWFLSGVGMMYVSFPSVTPADRLAHAAALDGTTIRVSALDAARVAGVDPSRTPTRLNTFDGRPVYRFSSRGDERVVFADDGTLRGRASDATLARMAARWSGQDAGAARAQTMTDVDQWTVQGPVRRQLPLVKYTWPDGEEVYTSPATGEIAQHTTRTSRVAAYLGPIPHWFYITPLRKEAALWSQVVIWTAAAATITTAIGLLIALSVYSPSRRYQVNGARSSLPYRGWKRRHLLLGFVFGLPTAAWAFSGMLSMEPFPLRTPRPARSGPTVAEVLRPPPDLASLSPASSEHALQRIGKDTVKELEFARFAGAPGYVATLTDGTTAVVPASDDPRVAVPPDWYRVALDRVTSPGRVIETRILQAYDWYYLDRGRRLPLPVLLVVMDDPGHSRAYVDPSTGRVVGQYSDGNWMSRWLYEGLHSWNAPWLYAHRPLWDLLVIGFMAGGAALAITSIRLALGVVGGRWTRHGRSSVDGDAPGVTVR